MSGEAKPRTEKLGLDQGKLLGFRHLPPIENAGSDLARGADAAFNKRITEGPPPAPSKT